MYLKRIYKFKNVEWESVSLIHMHTTWEGRNLKKKKFVLENLIGNAENDHVCFLVALHISAGFCIATALYRVDYLLLCLTVAVNTS